MGSHTQWWWWRLGRRVSQYLSASRPGCLAVSQQAHTVLRTQRVVVARSLALLTRRRQRRLARARNAKRLQLLAAGNFVCVSASACVCVRFLLAAAALRMERRLRSWRWLRKRRSHCVRARVCTLCVRNPLSPALCAAGKLVELSLMRQRAQLEPSRLSRALTSTRQASEPLQKRPAALAMSALLARRWRRRLDRCGDKGAT